VTRRTSERHSRRVEVRFWRRGNPQPHSGYTVDVSKSGMFLGTSVQLEPGERVRLEVLDREKGFIIEGQVARIHRVALALRHLEQPGVGIRFLVPAELVAELLQGAKLRTGSSASLPRPPGMSPATSSPREPAPSAAPTPPPAFATAASAAPASAPTRAARSIPVEFVDRASFLAVYHRDIAAGGLFVTTDSPAALHEIVLIDLRPPLPASSPLQFEARVVHRIDPQSGGDRSGSSGMGVQFLDPDRVRATLAPVLTELQR
jgi:Tfp pilus assembly protein PilZ